MCNFNKEIDQLHQNIQEFNKEYNSNKAANVKYAPIFSALASLDSDLSGVLDGNGSDGTDDVDTCKVKAIRIIKPNEFAGARRAAFPKTTIHIELELEDDCTFDANTKAKFIFGNNTTQETSLTGVHQNGKTVSASLEIDFTNYTRASYAKIKIQEITSSEKISYYPQDGKLDNYNNAEKTIGNYIWWTKSLYLNDTVGTETEIKSICPGITLDEGGKYVLMADFKKTLSKNQDINALEAGSIDITTPSIPDLETLKTKYDGILKILNKVKNKLGHTDYVLDDLKEQYIIQYKSTHPDVEQVPGLKGLFDREYTTQLANNAEILRILEQKASLITQFTASINREIIERSIPQTLIDQANALARLKQEQSTPLSDLKKESVDYKNKTVVLNTFQEWKDALDRINRDCTNMQQAWDALWNPFKQAVQDYETANPNALKNNYYTEWKTSDHDSFFHYLNSTDKTNIDDILTIKKNIKVFQDTIDQTGGDGALEYLGLTENKISDEERKRFSRPTLGKTTLTFEESDEPLFDDTHGPVKEDIKQGEVGDCYLMSALISLTKDNQALIRNLIKEVGGNFEVTLYKEGIPVTTTVDKRLIVRSIPDYVDSMPTAQIIDDVWVPIIEKAYAKLFGSTPTDLGGDLMKIEGGDSASALKNLLGPRVKTPKKLHLDENNLFVQDNGKTTVDNPMYMNKVSEDKLKKFIQAANTADYEIHVSSPDTYTIDGTTYTLGDHDIVPIDGSSYMSFNHAYSLVNATATNITIRNPHGTSTKEQGVFSEVVKKDVTALFKAIKAVEAEFNGNPPSSPAPMEVTKNTKVAMDKAIADIRSNTLIRSRFTSLMSDWDDWIEDLQEENDIWTPINPKAGPRKRLVKRITALKTAIKARAERKHKTKNGEMLKDGFYSREVTLNAEQTISYANLKKFFQRVTISIIS